MGVIINEFEIVAEPAEPQPSPPTQAEASPEPQSGPAPAEIGEVVRQQALRRLRVFAH